MESRTSKKNHDANRQNMATSIVKANIYSNLVTEGLKCITALTSSELNENKELTEASKCKLVSIQAVAKTCIDTNK